MGKHYACMYVCMDIPTQGMDGQQVANNSRRRGPETWRPGSDMRHDMYGCVFFHVLPIPRSE